MGYFDKFDAQETKLENILEDKCLLHKFRADTYPMSLTITQNQDPEAQMEMYATETDGVSSKDAKLVLLFPVGEIIVRMYGRLIIPDTLLNKIKNCGKKMRDLYLQGDYARRMEGWTKPDPDDEDEPLEESSEDDDEETGSEGAED